MLSDKMYEDRKVRSRDKAAIAASLAKLRKEADLK
jgi:hypothetical protein